MQKEKALYRDWLSYPLEDPDLFAELQQISDDEDAIYDRFYRDLSFGTAGLRGIIGAGTNRMNIYTVRRATQGLADMLRCKKKDAAVAVSYDSRIKSDLFARAAASVLASNGIRVHIVDRLMPTPVLSFCVRHLHCDAGIMITASHNPAAYNGYKAYGPDGCQMNAEDSKTVMQYAEKVDMFGARHQLSFEQGLEEGLIRYVPQSVFETYYDRVASVSIRPEALKKADLHLVYTPLCGTGNEPVRALFSKMGLSHISVVAEQEKPNGNFPTCPYPNPEIREALELGCRLLEQKGADLLIATDPDADRVGIAVRDRDGKAQLMSGNAVGVLLLDYLAAGRQAAGTLPKDAVAVKSIVTTDMAARVAAHYGIEMRNVLTGFKYIGEQIRLLEEKGQQDRFLFAYEESYGYLAGTFVRDKDAMIGALLIAEMASYYKLCGKTLLEVYAELEAQYGCYEQHIDSFSFEGASGMKKMNDIMERLRACPPTEIGGLAVQSISDYEASETLDAQTGKVTPIDLPSSNVLQYRLAQNCALIVRPSGTEPKIKFYYTVVSDDRARGDVILSRLAKDAAAIVR